VHGLPLQYIRQTRYREHKRALEYNKDIFTYKQHMLHAGYSYGKYAEYNGNNTNNQKGKPY
jgi:hypothetical protein